MGDVVRVMVVRDLIGFDGLVLMGCVVGALIF